MAPCTTTPNTLSLYSNEWNVDTPVLYELRAVHRDDTRENVGGKVTKAVPLPSAVGVPDPARPPVTVGRLPHLTEAGRPPVGVVEVEWVGRQAVAEEVVVQTEEVGQEVIHRVARRRNGTIVSEQYLCLEGGKYKWSQRNVSTLNNSD